MLTGKELGKAIDAALTLKGISKADLARLFTVKPPSVAGWINTGRISKPNFEKLRNFLSDVVGPEHWGLEASAYTKGTHVQETQAADPPRQLYRMYSRHIEAVLAMMEGATEEQQLQCVGAVATVLGCRPPTAKNLRRRTGT